MGYILGISSGYHDSAAALVKDGLVVGACEEERFTGIKHDNTFPHNTIEWLLNKNNISKDDLDAICFYENPIDKIDRIKTSTKRGGIFNYFKRKKIVKRNENAYTSLYKEINNYKGKNTKVVFSEHHHSHAAYSYYTSPYSNSIIVSVDGVGEWETTSIYLGTRNQIKKLKSYNFPNSLGMFYSAMTAFLGFKPNEGEYKVMGLAPYGNPKKYINKLNKIIYTKPNGEFEIDMKYFTYDYSDTHMFNEKLSELLEIPNRLPEDKLTKEHKDLAASVQKIYEKIFFHILNYSFTLNESKNLCLSGGCAYNGTANGKILNDTKFNNLWIPPAPSDSGSSIGAALSYYYSINKDVLRVKNTNPFLGPSYNKSDILKIIENNKDKVYLEYHQTKSMVNKVAQLITDGNIVGWFEGNMEFGARALGNRSILANPRDPQMKSRLNKVVKKREGFRPFAPIVTRESQVKFFKYSRVVPYMNQVVSVKEEYRKKLPALTHVDGSSRIQSLDATSHTRIYSLLKKLEEINEYPIVINTSFNLKDETMVLTPQQAIDTFCRCDMDALVIENYLLYKTII